ncbi:MAG: hypothetical protein P8J32_04690 [bacterium]|nr:hypothetical protein [bacterium]
MANRGKAFFITKEDLAAIELGAGRGAHSLMMGNTSVRGGAQKSKKAYNRKRKHKGEWQ